MTFKLCLDDLFCDLGKIRHTRPLIHNITNLVVMPITANMLLALGASPIMAHAKEEIPAVVRLSQALAINMGTPDEHWVDAMILAQKNAKNLAIPIVFDPVGAGATHYRTETAKKILRQGVTVIRGNASEIMALENANIRTKGVDSTQKSHAAVGAAQWLAKHYHCTVVVSGETDHIIDEDQHMTLSYGTPLFTRLVGMGCTLTAIIAAFLSVTSHPFLASLHAVALFGLIGQLSEPESAGPGSFYTQLCDNLYKVKQSDLQRLLTSSTELLST